MKTKACIPNLAVKFLVLATLAFGLVLTAFPGVPALHAGNNVWTPMGLYGAAVQVVAIAPENNQVIYAGLRSTTGTAVFKSTDGGVTWSPRSNGLGSEGVPEPGVWDLAIDPNQPNTVYAAGMRFGVYKSTDGGGTWVKKTNYASSFIAISPLDGVLFAAQGLMPGPTPVMPGIVRSKDGGETWESIGNLPIQLSGYCVLAIAPSAPHIMYLGCQEGGLARSIDGGTTWQRSDSSFGAPPQVLSIFVDAHDAQLVYIGLSGSGLFKTANGGQNWTPIGTGLGSINVNDIQVDPRNQQVMYATGGPMGVLGPTTFGVYRSLDNAGQSWTAMNDGMGNRPVISLAIDNSTPQNLYAGTDNGIWKYTAVSGRTDFSISIDEGALFTNQTAVTLTLTAPPGTSQMLISNDGGFGGAMWEPFSPIKPWTITAYGSGILPRITYAKFMTNGAVSGQYQDDIILDQVAPTGLVQITAPKDAARGSSDLSFTNTVFIPFVAKNYVPDKRQIGLALAASDDLSGVDRVSISNEPSFAGAAWQAYAPRLNWYANDHGTTIVRVKFRDRAGNESPVYAASTTAP